jgi:voltage-gated potassium channel Kch
MAKAKVIISTLIDKEPNLLILKKFKSLHNKPVIIVIASQASEAIKLYEAGADYVVLPHFIAGEQVSELIEKAKTSHSDYRQAKERELKALMKKVAKDSEHPVFAHIEQGGA